MQLTLTPPIIEQTEIYHIMLFLPYFGANQKMITREPVIRTPAKAKKPGAKKSFWKAEMVLTACSCGPFRAMMTDPTMPEGKTVRALIVPDRGSIQRKQPIQPKNESFSLRKIEDKIAQMTTERAPSGVFGWMSVNAKFALRVLCVTYHHHSVYKGISGKVTQLAANHHDHASPP